MYDFTIYSTECKQIKLLLSRHVRYIRIKWWDEKFRWQFWKFKIANQITKFFLTESLKEIC